MFILNGIWTIVAINGNQFELINGQWRLKNEESN
jgi:hypothetical protein